MIKTEVVGERIHVDWEGYADLLFLASIAESTQDPEKAVGHFEAGLKAWDGIGFRDRVQSTKGIYATYKLALSLIAAHRLDQEFARFAEIRRRLLKMQREDGGFVTDYDRDGRPVGQANVETTSLAVLALDHIQAEMP